MYASFVAGGLPPVPDPVETEDQAGIMMGVGLLSRWPIAATSAHRVPSEGRELNALLASIDHPDGPLRVVVSGTSWEMDRLDELSDQLKHLSCLVADPLVDGPLPVLLLGDFNAPPHFPGMAEVTSRLVDTWASVRGPDDDGRTLSETNRFAPREAELQFNERIDYVFVRPGTKDQRIDVRSADVIRDEVGGLPPSDHYAVVAEFDQVPLEG
jgi:endonuclease/exonuclease/phosphatase family metal-dependent hydrolase